ncbi:BREX-3 system phosphatase PglZ [Methanosarcina sp. T3]|uniref:BREX-3 system phosphatase PglZ n=1 Tax=Methanosarcina sp. T3 TaxID=3439062 RepID=UPI003F8684EA
MSNWRDTILKEFVPNVSKLTLVADPDALLTEEKLALELKNLGFDLLEFNDPVEFRYTYESKYRVKWDNGEYIDLIVVLRKPGSELENLPYDLQMTAGGKLVFNLGELFPNFSYLVIEKLDRCYLDSLFEAQKKYSPDRMGDNASKDFILSHVFGIELEHIGNVVELLRALLRFHYNKMTIPKPLSDRLVQVLKQRVVFHEWPLEEIVPDEKAFFAFLQERWPVFLDSLSPKKAYGKSSDTDFKYPGPDVLPFDHQDIRVYIDNLFVEGKLTPVQRPEVNFEAHSWIRSGIAETKTEYDDLRIKRLIELVEKDAPHRDSRYSDWLEFAMKWAELGALIHQDYQAKERKQTQQIGINFNMVFAEWLDDYYEGLANLPPMNLAMLHHVPRMLARELEDEPGKGVALIVVDGLSFEQWITIRQILHEQDQNMVMRESATFAWIPTITSVSRQAIFAGNIPYYYPLSINTTNKESNLWRQFWEGNGLSRLDVVYKRGLGEGDIVKAIDDTLNPGKTKVIGLVIDKVDKIMHGMHLGAVGMHNQIRLWCQEGSLSSLIGYLLDQDYQVWLTSDHGNIECYGKGKPSEGAIAETRGERVRVYPTPELRDSVASSFTFALKWEPTGLPKNYFPLVAGGSDAFINEGEKIVSHGGISIEEVIVPLVKFERKTR